jgi:hypothetical protein
MMFASATKFNRKSRGSGVEKPAVLFLVLTQLCYPHRAIRG